MIIRLIFRIGRRKTDCIVSEEEEADQDFGVVS